MLSVGVVAESPKLHPTLIVRTQTLEASARSIFTASAEDTWASLRGLFGRREKERKWMVKPTIPTTTPTTITPTTTTTTLTIVLSQSTTTPRRRICRPQAKASDALWWRFGSCRITWRTTSSYWIITEPIGLLRKLSSASFGGIMRQLTFGRKWWPIFLPSQALLSHVCSFLILLIL